MTGQLGTRTGCRHRRRFTSMCASARFYRHMRRSGPTQQIGQWRTAEHIARLTVQNVARRRRHILTGHTRWAHRHTNIRFAGDPFRHPRTMAEIERQRKRRT